MINRGTGLCACSFFSLRNSLYHARILKVFSYLYMVKLEILSRLLLSVQAFAFRGRLMSLLAPAGGMSTLPAKGGFSRPSLKPVPASSSNASKHASSAQGSKEAYPSSTLSARPFFPQDKEGFGSDTSHAEQAVFFFKEFRACTPSNSGNTPNSLPA